ncbi:MAG: hypothetical protein V3V56_05135 [bacterium]
MNITHPHAIIAAGFLIAAAIFFSSSRHTIVPTPRGRRPRAGGVRRRREAVV